MKLTCPHCGVTGSIDDKFIGKKLKCPKCSQSFTVSEEEAMQAPPPIDNLFDEIPSPSENRSKIASPDHDDIPKEQENCTSCGNTFPEDELIELGGRLICAACKPVALQKLKEGAVESGSGGLESGIAGHYTLQAKEVLSEAWAKVKGSKGSILFALFLMNSITGFLQTICGAVLSMLGIDENHISLFIVTQISLQLIIILTSMIFYSGLMMMGVRRAADEPISFSMIYDGFAKAKPLIIAIFLKTIMIALGFALLILPGIYLSIAYYLTYPLIMDKDLSPWEAMEASRKAIHHHWFQVFGLYFVMMLLIGFSAIPLGIGLIWTLPMGVIMTGIIYRTIFGTEK